MREYGIKETHELMENRLREYIRAQYFAQNELLLEATKDLLDKENFLSQEPYIEATPSYTVSKDGFLNADIDDKSKEYLQELADRGLGVYTTPYTHQIKAIESYVKGNDVLITTGTGSGKTECFLWPMLLEVIRESTESEETWEKEGIRTLILYPMNALVSDQLGRIRNILGRKDDAFMELIKSHRNEIKRRVRFGMYTGRTSYPGENKAEKTKKLGNKLEEFYLNTKEDEYKERVLNELQKIGRIPAKNMEAFISSLKNGKQITLDEDSELLTRAEMQNICPDILITNYSMLEYMLMRPIEQSIWDKTKKWLNLSKNNKFTLIVDEAHMYRGASGGEVSLLIRRLMDKLEVDESKFRCILTSASVPDVAEKELNEFACNLVGKDSRESKFSIIKGNVQKLYNNETVNSDQLDKLLLIDRNTLYKENNNLKEDLKEFYSKNNWEYLDEDIFADMYEKLIKYPPMAKLIDTCSGKAKSLLNLSSEIFPMYHKEKAIKATEVLLSLGTIAKSSEERVLLPSRVHMLFKGLNGIYACVNPNCNKGHSKDGYKIGKLFDTPKFECDECGSRVFELSSDRSCGAIFIRAYGKLEGDTGFLWTEKSSLLSSLEENHLYLTPENYLIDKKNNYGVANLDIKTGEVCGGEAKTEGQINILLGDCREEDGRIFTKCPNCGVNARIFSYRTRGNEPFANLVVEQLLRQPPKDESAKNLGKKVLLFSDSRQRAAKLARDLTIASDGDSGRQALYLAIKELEKKEDSNSLNYLYHNFVKVVADKDVSFFYGEDKNKLDKDVRDEISVKGQSKARLGLGNKIKNRSRVITNPPSMYFNILFKNLFDKYRSLRSLCLAEVRLIWEKEELEEIVDYLNHEYKDLDKEIIMSIFNAWADKMIRGDMGIFPEVENHVRNNVVPYDRNGSFGVEESEKLPKFIREIMLKKLKISEEDVKEVEAYFIKEITERGKIGNNRFLKPEFVTITTDIDKWYRCKKCTSTASYHILGQCINCGSMDIKELNCDDMNRYSFWRRPVQQAFEKEEIVNFITEEHTAQLSHKEQIDDVISTTEEYEMRFRNIKTNEKSYPIDILSCTTTMEVGIDIGSLTAVGMRNVPPMRENYQQRAGRAGRKGSAVSTIVTYTEDGPHDLWYYNNPDDMISGEPRQPWIDHNNEKLIRRHINMIILQDYFICEDKSIDGVDVLQFFSENEKKNYEDFIKYLREFNIDCKRKKILVPNSEQIHLANIKKLLEEDIMYLKEDIRINKFRYIKSEKAKEGKMLLDVLLKKGILPNYSFPKDVVNFWIDKDKGSLEESPERSIDIALSEYAPGKLLVVNKKSYISGGLYDYYSKKTADKEIKSSIAKKWLELDEFKKKIFMCRNHNCGWFGIDNVEQCPLCDGEIDVSTMVKPWGFSPREGTSISENKDTQEYSAISTPSYSTMPRNKDNMKFLNENKITKFENRNDQLMIIINKGPKNSGFDLCNKCGAIDPHICTEEEKKNRKVPFIQRYMGRCNHDRENISLGYDFLTDMLVLEIKLDDSMLELKQDWNMWLIPALTTYSEALVLAASTVLDIEFSDLKSGFRIRHNGAQLFADVYMYDSLSSGAGYSTRVTELLDKVLDSAEKRLESCDCEGSCPSCVRHFWNQNLHINLDRKSGLQMLRYARDSRLEDELPIEEQVNLLESISPMLDSRFDGYKVISENKGLKIEIDGEKFDVIIYPAMLSEQRLKKKKNYIYIPDMLIKKALPEVAKLIEKNIC